MSALERQQREFLAELFAEAPASRAGLETYRRNALANLRGVLAAVYPVVHRLVGEAFFREAAARFARAQPSTSGDLNLYGARFADFLAAYPFARELPYLPDMARLEWACHESFHAADGATLDAAALAAVPPERHGAIRFVLHPAVRLVASEHPVLSIWEANQPQRDGTPAASTGGEYVIVTRTGGEVSCERASPAEWHCVAAFARGHTIEEAIDAARPQDFDFLAPLLARLAANGALAGFTAPEAGA